MISIGLVEAVYLAINGAALVITVGALRAARTAVDDVREFNGSTRGIVARGNVRREWFRLGSQSALLSLAVPSILSADEIPLSYFVVVLMAVSMFILANTLSDRSTRRHVMAKAEEEIDQERETSQSRMEARLGVISDAAVVQGQRLEQKLDENTRISTEANKHAQEAFHEANSVNQKIADQGAQIVAQGERQDRRDAGQAKLQVVADDTAEQVHEIHDVTVPGDAS